MKNREAAYLITAIRVPSQFKTGISRRDQGDLRI
jgi:hypothetical protein